IPELTDNLITQLLNKISKSWDRIGSRPLSRNENKKNFPSLSPADFKLSPIKSNAHNQGVRIRQWGGARGGREKSLPEVPVNKYPEPNPGRGPIKDRATSKLSMHKMNTWGHTIPHSSILLCSQLFVFWNPDGWVGRTFGIRA
ncbi:hypothetical protein GWI33_010336, partial [Rhynchophorus ferrugineus]